MNKIELLHNALSSNIVNETIFDCITDDDMLRKEADMQRNRLSNTGEYFDGSVIRTFKAAFGQVYSFYTIGLKKAIGQRTDIVTLKDSGEFYFTIQAEIGENNVFLSADFQKADGNIGDNVDADKILGFCDKDMKDIGNEVKKRFRSNFFKQLKKNASL